VSDNDQSFDATFKWAAEGPLSVHSYPYVRLGSPLLPIQFQNVTSFDLSATWAMGLGNNTVTTLDSDGLARDKVVANVAYDIWADADHVRAGNDTSALIEIMIWIGNFGDANPLGYGQNSSCWKQKLGNDELYVVRPLSADRQSLTAIPARSIKVQAVAARASSPGCPTQILRSSIRTFLPCSSTFGETTSSSRPRTLGLSSSERRRSAPRTMSPCLCLRSRWTCRGVSRRS
jgi:hypothetical protein